MVLREAIRLSLANPWRIPPITGAVAADGRLVAISVNSQVLLLWLGLEVSAGFDPHIGGLYISEGLGSMMEWFTSIVGPGPGPGHRGPC